MMKKVLLVLTMLTLGIGLVGCGTKNQKSEKKTVKQETIKEEKDKKFVAFVTDVGNIDDKSFNEGSWNGVKAFADKNNYKSEYFRPALDTIEARGEAVDKAADAGADIIVLCGFLFESVVYEKQKEYKDIEFLYVDAEPKDKDGKIKYEKNTSSIIYKEEEVGYLAGYAAVKDGFKKLGFLGGMDIPAVRAFGYGYVQGAEAAAKELKKKNIEIAYKYAGAFSPSDDITSDIKGWYKNGTEIVFSCGGAILYSVIEATGGKDDRKIIGVDVNQAAESEHIVYSAMKGLENSIIKALQDYDKNGGKWSKERSGNKTLVGVKEDGVGLSATKDSWRLENMTIDEYNKMFEQIKNNDLNIDREELPKLKYVKLNKIN